ncbi:MAG: MXAN_6640 family putative metalloprotease [Bacteroidota bacterium]
MYINDHRQEVVERFGSRTLAILQRPAMQKSVVRDNIRIHYDTTGTNTPAMLDASYQRIQNSYEEFVDSVAAIAGHVIEFETAVLGYPSAPEDGSLGGGPEYDIIIQELGSLYGSATPDDAPIAPRRYTTFITIDNDFVFVNPDTNKGIPALRVTLAHEYHHAIQLGNYGYWSGGEIYYYEMTSVWMEDEVYTDVNDYYAYLRSSFGHFRRPDRSFTTSEFIMYSRGIWCQYVAKRFGRESIKRSWEIIASVRPLEAIDLSLREVSGDFRSAFAEWTKWNYFTGSRADTTYYPEGAYFPQMIPTVVGFTPPSRSVSSNLEALSARYYQVLKNDLEAVTLALSNINFAAAVENTGELFPYTYLLNTSELDDSYLPTSIGIFVKLDVPDRTNWFTQDIAGSSGIKNGIPFPNPFVVDGNSFVSIGIGATSPVPGTLYIYSVDMNLVYSSTISSVSRFEKHVFLWNGRGTNNEVVQSGVYLFILELPDNILKGKIVAMRR